MLTKLGAMQRTFSFRSGSSIARLLLVVGLALFVQSTFADSTIFIVRHAEKAAGSGATADDPDLSPTGRARAKSLARILRHAGITAVYATEFKRTQQTAAPTATAARVPVTEVPGKETPTLVTKLRTLHGNALVVGHSNTVPEIIKALGLPKAGPIADADYDNLYIVVRGSPPHLIRLHYR